MSREVVVVVVVLGNDDRIDGIGVQLLCYFSRRTILDAITIVGGLFWCSGSWSCSPSVLADLLNVDITAVLQTTVPLKSDDSKRGKINSAA